MVDRVAAVIGQQRIRAGIEQPGHLHEWSSDLVAIDHMVKGRVSLVVLDVGVGAVLEENAHGIKAIVPTGPMQDRVATIVNNIRIIPLPQPLQKQIARVVFLRSIKSLGATVGVFPGLVFRWLVHGSSIQDLQTKHSQPFATGQPLVSCWELNFIFAMSSRLILNQQLWIAACNNDAKMVEMALVAGADPDFRDSPSDPTADEACFSTHSILHEASLRGHVDVVSLLLRHGAEQSKDGLYGLTPLHLACLNGHVEVAKALISRGAQVDARCDTGDTALMTALMGENPYSNSVPWLHEKMAAPDRVKELVDVLVRAGADINAPNDPSETPVWNAIRYHDADMMTHLISHGADINHQTLLDEGLLSEAAQALSRADSWGDIPHRRKEGLNMRKRVLSCLTVLHQNGLQWQELPSEEILLHFPSESIHRQMRAMWMSMASQGNGQHARSASL